MLGCGRRVDRAKLAEERQSLEGRAWRSMRNLRRFTLDDLVATVRRDASVPVSVPAVRAYVTLLRRAGFVRREAVRGNTRAARAVYRLLRASGSRPPRWPGEMGLVWDPNDDTVHAEVPRD